MRFVMILTAVLISSCAHHYHAEGEVDSCLICIKAKAKVKIDPEEDNGEG